MKNYELTCLISPELGEEGVKSFQDKIISLIQNEGGILIESITPAKKVLAYPVKKQKQAYLAVLIFQLNPEKLAGLEKNLNTEGQILRYLVLIKRPIKVVPRKAVRKPLARPKEKKVELKEIEKKLEEILDEPK